MVYNYSKILNSSIGSEPTPELAVEQSKQALAQNDPRANHAVVCCIQWLKFLAWEEFDEEI